MSKFIKSNVIFALLALSINANAATIGTFNYGSFAQNGSATNQHSETLVGVQIDFVADSGSPASGIWELPPIGSLGNPAGTFTNSPHPQGAFTVTWSGLNVGTGSSFNYTGLDYGGWNGSFVDEGLIPFLIGNEFVTLFFGNGSSVSSFFSAGSISGGGQLLFDDADLVVSAVPVPAAAWLFGSALLGFLGFSRKKS